MVASFAVIRSANYYTRESSAIAYYGAGGTGVWLRGHERLGIAIGDIVRADDFDRVCAGVDRNGKALVKLASGPRMLGVDVTLSSPKSVSVLWAMGDDALRATIDAAERKAVEAVLSLIEQEIPLARRGKNGATREHGKFLAAVFTHSEARPEEHSDGTIMPSMQRHHHLCLPSVIERSDGTWGALDSVGLRSWKKALGALYRLELATGLQEAGFEIEKEEEDWRWSIAGVPEMVCKFFSPRRATLEEELTKHDLSSRTAPALAAAINLGNRRAKENWTGDQLTAAWHIATKNLGFEPKTIVNTALNAGRVAERLLKSFIEKQREHVASIPARLTEHSATFGRRELIEATANSLVGTSATASGALHAVNQLIEGNCIVKLAVTRDGPVFSTPQLLTAERALVTLVSRNAAARVAAPGKDDLDRIIANACLNSEQQAFIRAGASGQRLVLGQGGAGTGKSTCLEVITAAWQSAGYSVLGAAIAWRAANTLTEDLGIKAFAIDALLASIDFDKTLLDRRTCLIIEEGGLASTPQALRLLEAIDRSGGVAIIVGDEHQLRPVGPGHAMRLIREAIGAVTLGTVVRQRELWAREAPTAFAHGDAETALAAFSERALIHSFEGPRATIEALAAHWQQLSDAAPHQSVLVTAKTNAEARALSAAIRNRLRERGTIVGPDTTMEAVDASGNRYALRLAVGDKIRFLGRYPELQVVNGTEARVCSIGFDTIGGIQIEAETDGRRFSFSPADIADAKGRARLAHAYCATIFLAQGMTVDRSLVLLSGRFDRHDAYVASSRAREQTEFFLDVQTLDKEIEQTQLSTGALTQEAARIAYLSERLTRQSIKTNAIDLLADDERKRHRSKELTHEL